MGWLAAIVLGLLVLGYGAHRLLLWAEARGYVYYLDKTRRPGPPLGLLAHIYEPEIEYVVEEESGQYIRREDDESGRGDRPHRARHDRDR